MSLSRKAQSSIEYALMMAAVITGIMIVGPYAIRAINAHFQIIAEDTQESYKEIPRQGPIIIEVLPGCECSGLIRGACGNGLDCPRTQRVYSKTCTPVGCEASLLSRFGVLPYECRNDGCCLDGWDGLCGPNAIHVPGGCPDGQGEILRECDLPSVYSYFCQDPTTLIPPIIPNPCLFACVGNKSDYANWCPGYNIGLRNNTTPVLHYDSIEGCPGSPQCAAQCFPTFIHTATRANCVCPPGYVPVDPSALCGGVLCASNSCCSGACTGPGLCDNTPR